MKKKIKKQEASPFAIDFLFVGKKGKAICNRKVSLMKLLKKFLLEPLMCYFCLSTYIPP